MAKTPLNNKLDKFFQKYAKTPITEKSFEEYGLDIKEANDYGNLLHAAVNYDYEGKRIMEFINVLLKKGINVNYRGSATGLTFIHLALYGYTTESGNDQPYHEDFIVDLILKARKYGLNVNIKDNDEEDIPTCAVASEVYNGSVIKIIEALGPEYELPNNFLDIYQKYMDEAKMYGDKKWFKRLESEFAVVKDYVNKKNLNLDELNAILKEKKNLLFQETGDLTYEKLTESYEIINALICEIKKLLSNRSIFDVDNSEDEKYLDTIIEKTQSVLNNQLTIIESNPHSESLNVLKTIAQCLSLIEIINRIEEISKNYQDYLESLRKEAKSTKTINECQSMLSQIKTIEIFEELKDIIENNLSSITLSISETRDSYISIKETRNIVKTFIDVEEIDEEPDYNSLTIEELNNISKANMELMDRYKSSIKNKVSSMYQQLFISLNPLIQGGLINLDEIKEIFSTTSKPKKNKEKKR